MIPRFLNLQGMIGIAASLLLVGLFVVKAGEARHWRKQSGRYEQLYVAEKSARLATIANYRAAAETARKADLANASRVAAAQRTISERTTHDLETRLADARARAQRLQLADRTPAAANGSGRAAPVPAASPAPGALGGAAAQDGFPLPDQRGGGRERGLGLDDALIATEQAIQLDELIKWVRAQGAVETREPSRQQ